MSSRTFISTLINHAKSSNGTCLRSLFQTSLTSHRQYSTEPAFRLRSKLTIGLINQKLNPNAKQHYQQTRETPIKWLFCILFAAGFAVFTSIFGVAHAQENQFNEQKFLADRCRLIKGQAYSTGGGGFGSGQIHLAIHSIENYLHSVGTPLAFQMLGDLQKAGYNDFNAWCAKYGV
jgi:hypothetical protein